MTSEIVVPESRAASVTKPMLLMALAGALCVAPYAVKVTPDGATVAIVAADARGGGGAGAGPGAGPGTGPGEGAAAAGPGNAAPGNAPGQGQGHGHGHGIAAASNNAPPAPNQAANPNANHAAHSADAPAEH